MEGAGQDDLREVIVFDGAANAQRQSQPNVRGLHVAMVYFTSRGFRVSIVLPQSWLQEDQHGPLWSHHPPHLYDELLPSLVTVPNGFDDDAYALQFALLENQRAAARRRLGHLQGPAYLLTNDLFRDISRGQLRTWLNDGIVGTRGPGRIRFCFGNLGGTEQNGDRELEFLPSPQHPLIQQIQGGLAVLP